MVYTQEASLESYLVVGQVGAGRRGRQEDRLRGLAFVAELEFEVVVSVRQGQGQWVQQLYRLQPSLSDPFQ